MSSVPLADIVLAAHFGIVLFNIFGLVAVPAGAWAHWRFVHVRWWRAVHLLSLLAVAAQAASGRVCFLTYWQAALEGGKSAEVRPMILQWINDVMFWNLSGWVFVALYLAVLVYAALLWRWVPPRRANSRSYWRSSRR